MAPTKSKSVNRKRVYLVFVSHSSKDRWIARQMAATIEREGKGIGLQVFLDEKDIQGGDSIPDSIRTNLRACDELVVLLTPYSVKREWVLVEIAGAWVLGKRVVAIMDKVPPRDMPDVIVNCRGFDLNDWDTYLDDLKQRALKARSK
jgi:hypothetical protein